MTATTRESELPCAKEATNDFKIFTLDNEISPTNGVINEIEEPYGGLCKYFTIKKSLDLRPPYDSVLIKDIKEDMIKACGFDELDERTVRSMCLRDPWLSAEVVHSIHEHACIDRVELSVKFLEQSFSNLKEEFEKGKTDSFSFCIEKDIPPLLWQKFMLRSKGYAKKKLEKLLKGKTSFISDESDLCEASKAIELDRLTSTVYNSERQRERSERFEQKVKEYLEQLEIPFTSEAELQEEYRRNKRKVPVSLLNDDGTFVELPPDFNTENLQKTPDKQFYLLPGELEVCFDGLSPDFLFDKDPLFVNNREIRWLEVKSFIGGVSDTVTTTTYDRIKRYQNTLGGGAIVYAHGFVAGLASRLPKQLLLLDFEHFLALIKD